VVDQGPPETVGRLSATTGSVDPNFGSGGWTAFPTAVGGWPRIVVQPDDKIVLLGEVVGGDGGAAGPVVCGGATWNEVSVFVGRLSADGVFDRSFNMEGTTTTSLPYGSVVMPGSVSRVALGADGHIATAVTMPDDAGVPSFAAIRYTPDGNIDQTFGASGIAETSVGANACAAGVAIDAYGRVIVAGEAIAPGTSSIVEAVVVRYWP
jgi:hypothetical protein